MKKWMIASIVFIIVMVVAIIFIILSGIEKPEIYDVSLEWGELSHGDTEILADISVFNPNFFNIHIKNINFEYRFGDTLIGTSSSNDEIDLKPGTSHVDFNTKIINSYIPDCWIDHIENDELSYLFTCGEISFNLIITDYTLPIFIPPIPIETDILDIFDNQKESDTFFVQAPEDIDVQTPDNKIPITIVNISADWNETFLDSVIVDIDVTLNNGLKYFPITIPRLNFSVEAYSTPFITCSMDYDVKIFPNENETIRLTAIINNYVINGLWVQHLNHDELTKLFLLLNFDINILGEKIFGIEKILGARDFKTDLLNNIRC